ncbi:TetR family transcriptional regulator [Pseudarthrobacter sp. NPDC058329]|uniref:TetR family transcriptional regulator n=1 Tax=Pseudarthrobacter sp. NPDC058329 TaxID=3346448 RepID=UPI0036DBF91E
MNANMTQSAAAGTADQRRRGSYAGTDEKRLGILDAALKVFARDGYRGGSLKVVAREAGMSDAGLLHHFGSKSALLAAVLEFRDTRTEAVYTPMHVDDPYMILLGLVELARYNVSTPGLVRLHVTLSAEAAAPQHPAHGYFVQRYEYYIDGLTRAFCGCAERGTLRPGTSPVQAAQATIAAQDGLQLLWLLHGDSIDLPGGIEAHLRRLVEFPEAD